MTFLKLFLISTNSFLRIRKVHTFFLINVVMIFVHNTCTTYDQRFLAPMDFFIFLPQWNFFKPSGLNSAEFVNKSCLPLTSIVFLSVNYILLSKLPYVRPHMSRYHKQNIWTKFPYPCGTRTAKLR